MADADSADGYINRAKKPDKKNFEAALAYYRLDKSQMAHVGNNILQDIGGGNAAGVTTCLVRDAGEAMAIAKFFMRMVGKKPKAIMREKS